MDFENMLKTFGIIGDDFTRLCNAKSRMDAMEAQQIQQMMNMRQSFIEEQRYVSSYVPSTVGAVEKEIADLREKIAQVEQHPLYDESNTRINVDHQEWLATKEEILRLRKGVLTARVAWGLTILNMFIIGMWGMVCVFLPTFRILFP